MWVRPADSVLAVWNLPADATLDLPLIDRLEAAAAWAAVAWGSSALELDAA